jgi:hypothetical protein
MNTLIETQARLFASSKSWIEGEAVHQGRRYPRREPHH